MAVFLMWTFVYNFLKPTVQTVQGEEGENLLIEKDVNLPCSFPDTIERQRGEGHSETQNGSEEISMVLIDPEIQVDESVLTHYVHLVCGLSLFLYHPQGDSKVSNAWTMIVAFSNQWRSFLSIIQLKDIFTPPTTAAVRISCNS